MVVALVVGTGAGACGGGDAAPLRAERVPVPDTAMPATLAGFLSQPEDVSKAMEDAGERAFVTDVRLWSLREGERLRGTVEVARFAPDAPYTTAAFQEQVAASVGTSTPRRRRVGGDVVYVSAGNQQVYYTWFRGPHLVLLSVPTTTRNGRAVLRAALAEVSR